MEPKEEIRERIDVADLLGEYLTLKGAGQGSFKALCPFHAEKTPSFHISRPKQIWHCFGCGKGGDIFAFVMEMESMDFREALELLAKKAGVELPKTQRYEPTDAKDKMRAINSFAEKVFRKFLESPKGTQAQEYLKKRQIDNELAEKFGLGYAPDDWTELLKLARQKGIPEKDLIDAGLAIAPRDGKSALDRFRHRLMIPLRDSNGRTVGFTGRVLRDADTPKYMNSPQTLIYDKSAMIFGLDLAKTAIRREKAVVIVEGNLDVVASHKACVENIVGVSGTALTERQLSTLKRYATKLIFSFDADAAGFAAERRGMRLASSMGFDVRVAAIPSEFGKDPDDVVRKNPEAWRKIVEGNEDKMSFLFRRLVSSASPDDVTAKKIAGDEFFPEIAALSNQIEREHWVKKSSDALSVPIETIRRMAAQVPVHRPAAKEDTVAVSVAAPEYDKLSSLILSLAWESSEAAAMMINLLPEDALPEDGPFRRLYTETALVYNQTQFKPAQSFFEALSSHLSLHDPALLDAARQMAVYAEHFGEGYNASQGDKFSPLTRAITRVVAAHRKKRRNEVLSLLKRAEALQDKERVEALTKEYQGLV